MSPGWPRPPSSPSPQKKQSRGRRRRRPLGSVRWSSSSGDDSSEDGSSGDGSSGDSEDSELEEAPEAGAGGQALPSAQHTVPDMDLWVPARQSASELCRGGARGWPGHRAAPPSSPRASSEAQDSRAARPTASAPAEEAGQAHTPSGTHGTSVRGIGHPGSADTHLSSSEEPADEVGPRPQCTPRGCSGVTQLVLRHGGPACARVSCVPGCGGVDTRPGSKEHSLWSSGDSCPEQQPLLPQVCFMGCAGELPGGPADLGPFLTCLSPSGGGAGAASRRVSPWLAEVQIPLPCRVPLSPGPVYACPSQRPRCPGPGRLPGSGYVQSCSEQAGLSWERSEILGHLRGQRAVQAAGQTARGAIGSGAGRGSRGPLLVPAVAKPGRRVGGKASGTRLRPPCFRELPPPRVGIGAQGRACCL